MAEVDCIKNPITNFRIIISHRLDLGPDCQWHVHVSNWPDNFWEANAAGEFKDCLNFAEMGMQSVNAAVEKAKKICELNGHKPTLYPTGLTYCFTCGTMLGNAQGRDRSHPKRLRKKVKGR